MNLQSTSSKDCIKRSKEAFLTQFLSREKRSQRLSTNKRTIFVWSELNNLSKSLSNRNWWLIYFKRIWPFPKQTKLKRLLFKNSMILLKQGQLEWKFKWKLKSRILLFRSWNLKYLICKRKRGIIKLLWELVEEEEEV